MQTVFLNTTLSGGVQPYDPCTTWAGSYTASNGTTGLLYINGGPYVSGNPYIQSSNCVSGNGTLTGTFYPNGFTGAVGIRVYAKDASGIADESNYLEYSVIPEFQFNVSAGPDVTISNTSYTLQGAISGGTPPYTSSWTTMFKPVGTFPSYAPSSSVTGPFVANLVVDGTYTFRLSGADSAGHTGSDSVNVFVTGQTPPTIPFAIQWDNSIGTFNTFAGRYSTMKMWHKPVGSSGWVSTGFTNTSTGTSSNTGTIYLQLVDPAADELRVTVSGTNYKYCEIFGAEVYGPTTVFTQLADNTTYPVGTTAISLDTIVYVDSYTYTYYKVFGWTDFANCLVAGTLVKLADGTEIKVEDLQVNDLLASLNIRSSESWRSFSSLEFIPETTTTKVSAITPFKHKSYVKINKTINVSDSHPLFVFRDNTYRFVKAIDLDLMDKLISETGELIDITSIDLIDKPTIVYSLSTEPSHIYIADGVIHHNKKDPLALASAGTVSP